MQVSLNSSISQIKNTTLKKPFIAFKGGFTRLEDDIYRTGGISVWDKKAQDKIAKSLTNEQLKELMQLLEETENRRILFCDINSGGFFKNQLNARFSCTYMLKNYKEEVFKQKIFESKWKFLMRVLKQFNSYKNQLLKLGVKI